MNAARPIVMAYHIPPPEPDPSNRWPWIALLGGVVVILVVGASLLLRNRSGGNVQVETTPVAQAPSVASPAASAMPPSPLPTMTAAPTPPILPSPTPLPTMTPIPVATYPPGGATAAPVPTGAGVPPGPGAPGPVLIPSPPTATPPAAPARTPRATPTRAASPSPIVTAEPSAPAIVFTGQVSPPGGLGNTQPDVQAAYGPPTGETPGHLVAYKKGNTQYRVLYSPAPERALLIAVFPSPSLQTLAAAFQQARGLLPGDARQKSPAPEGNAQYALERFTSQLLAQALPASAFEAGNGLPGDFLVVVVRGSGDTVTRIIVGTGDDAMGLINRSQS